MRPIKNIEKNRSKRLMTRMMRKDHHMVSLIVCLKPIKTWMENTLIPRQQFRMMMAMTADHMRNLWPNFFSKLGSTVTTSNRRS